MKTQFNVGDKVRLINDHSYTGIITKTTYVPKKGLTDVLLYLDGNSHPSGFTSDEFELVIEKEKLDREQAIEWWNSLFGTGKQIELCEKYYPEYLLYNIKSPDAKDIEQIWRKETQQELEKSIIITNVEEKSKVDFETESILLDNSVFDTNVRLTSRPQVDFEMLNMWINNLKNYSNDLTPQKQNLLLFFELLSKSSTFAHKSHKELNKLMK